MVDTAKSFQELHVVVPCQLMLYGKTTKHIDAVEPTLTTILILVEVAFLTDTCVVPEFFEVDAVSQFTFVATLVSALVPFCHISDGHDCIVRLGQSCHTHLIDNSFQAGLNLVEICFRQPQSPHVWDGDVEGFYLIL